MDFAHQLAYELGLTESLGEFFTIVFGFPAKNVVDEFISTLRTNGYEASLLGEVDCEGALFGIRQLVLYRKSNENPKVTVLNLDIDSRLTVKNHRAEISLQLKGPHRLVINQMETGK